MPGQDRRAASSLADSQESAVGYSSRVALRPASILLLAPLLWLAGCRSQAHQDVYNEKLIAQVRSLEDQLNAADYEIRVLHQQLERQRQATEQDANRSDFPSRDSDKPSPRRAAPPREPAADDNVLDDLDIDLGSPSDLAPGDFRPGDVQPGDLPPIQPLPPREQDITPPPIEFGAPQPPLLQGEDVELPPGQIETPDSARLLLPPQPAIAVTTEIHPGLSGTHHHDSDSTVDGMYLVLTISDEQGKPMSISPSLAVVMLDPTRQGEEARLGRWDLTADQIAEQFRSSPLPSIQLPLLWQGKQPGGDEVAVFVRFTLEDGRQLETDLMLKLAARQPSDWKPQGLGTAASRSQEQATESIRTGRARPTGIDPASVWK
ncbi:hypothetical protein SH139x_001717 [Planctomycetaceae bacterium SH139]